jgi:hypothetical protein
MEKLGEVLKVGTERTGGRYFITLAMHLKTLLSFLILPVSLVRFQSLLLWRLCFVSLNAVCLQALAVSKRIRLLPEWWINI